MFVAPQRPLQLIARSVQTCLVSDNKFLKFPLVSAGFFAVFPGEAHKSKVSRVDYSTWSFIWCPGHHGWLPPFLHSQVELLLFMCIANEWLRPTLTSLSLSSPFSGCGCFACPFVFKIGKGIPRDAKYTWCKIPLLLMTTSKMVTLSCLLVEGPVFIGRRNLKWQVCRHTV